MDSSTNGHRVQRAGIPSYNFLALFISFGTDIPPAMPTYTYLYALVPAENFTGKRGPPEKVFQCSLRGDSDAEKFSKILGKIMKNSKIKQNFHKIIKKVSANFGFEFFEKYQHFPKYQNVESAPVNF